MMRNRYFKHVLLCSLITGILATACSDSDDSVLIIEPDPWQAILTISENKTNDVRTVNYQESYRYNDYIHLESCYTQQQVGEFKNTNHTTISFDQDANIYIYADEQGNQWTYHCDGNSLQYPSSCTYLEGGINERTYLFKYKDDNLVLMEEYIDGTLFSTARFDYSSSQQATLTIEMHGQTDVMNIKYTDNVHWNSFPNYFLIEYHPLSMHRMAYYSGLFGNNFRVIAQIQFEGADEITTFSYNSDLPTTCIMPQHCTQTISYDEEKYLRTVYYTLSEY